MTNTWLFNPLYSPFYYVFSTLVIFSYNCIKIKNVAVNLQNGNLLGENNKNMKPGPKIGVRNEKYISYFTIKTYVVGTQKNPLTETVLLSTQSTC